MEIIFKNKNKLIFDVHTFVQPRSVKSPCHENKNFQTDSFVTLILSSIFVDTMSGGGGVAMASSVFACGFPHGILQVQSPIEIFKKKVHTMIQALLLSTSFLHTKNQ